MEEQRALKLSAAGQLLMAGLGISFSLLTGSGAILLDGVFSLIGFLAALMSLWVAVMAVQPDDRHFQFGYGSFEPMFNLARGLLIIVISAYALTDAINTIRQGGREIQTGYAIVYAVLVAACCFAVAAYQWRASKRTGSSLVRIDAVNWLMDGGLTIAVLVAFIFAWFIRGTSLEWFIDFVDPSVVAMLVVLTLPVPFLIVRDNLREVLLAAPDKALQRRVGAAIGPRLSQSDINDYRVRLVKVGRYLYVHVIVLLGESDRKRDIAWADGVRSELESCLPEDSALTSIDVMFTADARRLGGSPDLRT